MGGIGLVIVGDEILSGKRQDRHFSQTVKMLTARGMELAWAHITGDDEAGIAEVFAAARQRGDTVLSCGGIGATPDDRTRQAAARAFNVPLLRHPEGEKLIIAQYGDTAFPHRVLMADFAQGSGLIPNPVNRVAGFHIHEHHFVPGFPEMAWPMLEWVLDVRYPHLRNAHPPVEYALRALGTTSEGDLLDLMEAVLAKFPGTSLSSLPFRGDAGRERHIEFGIKGQASIAGPAFIWFRGQLVERGDLRVEDLRVP